MTQRRRAASVGLLTVCLAFFYLSDHFFLVIVPFVEVLCCFGFISGFDLPLELELLFFLDRCFDLFLEQFLYFLTVLLNFIGGVEEFEVL